jgi:hypothetical protein
MAEQRYHLKVGEEITLEKGFPFWLTVRFGKLVVVYAGMPNASVYSLAMVYTAGYNSLAYNLYLPLTQTRVAAGKGYLEGVEATPEYIAFRYVKGS